MVAYHNRPRSSARVRWVVLLMVCITSSCTYYSLDLPAALHSQLATAMPSHSFETKFNLLFSLYSIPNTILPFFGGGCVDRHGASSTLIGYGVLAFMGQVLVTLGGLTKNWPLLLIGRFLYGLGGENICVAYSSILSIWFEGREVALAFSLSLATGRLGSVFNNFVSPSVANAASITWALGLGAALNSLALVAAACVGYIEMREHQRLTRNATIQDMLTESLIANAQDDEDPHVDFFSPSEEDQSISQSLSSFYDKSGEDESDGQTSNSNQEEESQQGSSALGSFSHLFYLLAFQCLVVYGCVIPFNNVASGLLTERNYFLPSDDSSCTLLFPNLCTSGTLVHNATENPSTDMNGNSCPLPNHSPILPTSLNVSGGNEASWKHRSYVYEYVHPSDVDCEDPFWSAACVADYCAARARSTEKAARIMSIPYSISALLSPFLGGFVDRLGFSGLIATLASAMLVCVHSALALRRDSPVIPLIFQGISYSLYAAVIWPSVPLTVQSNVVGRAYGIVVVGQNIGLALIPIVIAYVHNRSGGYIPNVEWLFVLLASCGTVAGLLLNGVDRVSGGRLNRRCQNEHGDEEPEFYEDLVMLTDS